MPVPSRCGTRDFLIETSPLFHADKINVPLMVLQGANDPRLDTHLKGGAAANAAPADTAPVEPTPAE